MRKILIVDDSLDTINLLKRVLKALEPDIVADYAFTAKEATILFNENKYSGAILDVSLPDITGYFLGQLIRNACPDMPIAFLTNYDGEVTKENAESISAKFWEKANLFTNTKLLRTLIMELVSESECGSSKLLELPSFIEIL